MIVEMRLVLIGVSVKPNIGNETYLNSKSQLVRG